MGALGRVEGPLPPLPRLMVIKLSHAQPIEQELVKSLFVTHILQWKIGWSRD